MKRSLMLMSLPLACAIGVSAVHAAPDPAAEASRPHAIAVAQADTTMTDGEVRKIDKENRKITLRHGEIRNLDMPGMTMVFQVKDPALLERVKQGDKVRFHAEQVNGAIIITALEPVR